MKRGVLVPALLSAVLVCPLLAAPAQAQAVRTFVSAAGSDSNNCANVATPCRHFQAAYNATAPGGEIVALDPANYGALNITRSVSVQGQGWAFLSAGNNVPAINISAQPTDKVDLRGLVLDGGNAIALGIAFVSGGSLNLQDSVIRNFAGGAIQFLTSAQLYVSNTRILDNGNTQPALLIGGNGGTNLNCVFNHVEIENNQDIGLQLGQGQGSGNVIINDSIIAGSINGIIVTGGGESPPAFNVMVRNSTITNNTWGLQVQNSGAAVQLTRTTITGNTNGWITSSGGTVQSYGDNNIDNNANFSTAPPPIANK
jgi:hypothetical protein